MTSKPPCPVCHDPNAYPLWISKEPPEACAVDESWHSGGPQTIFNVSECKYQRKRAEQAALFRKVAPEAFDQNGTMKPGMLGYVLERLPPNTTLVI